MPKKYNFNTVILPLIFFTFSIKGAPKLPVVTDKNPAEAVLGAVLFNAFDAALIEFMESKGFEAGTAAIAVGKNIVHKISIGWNDKAQTQPINLDVRMRIASITKGITHIALYQLMHGTHPAFTEATHFWDFLNKPYPQNFQPKFADQKVWQPSGMPEPKDPRIKDITIGELIDHKGGWDIGVLGFDPQGQPIRIQQALNLNGNPTADDYIKYMITMQPLQFTPGTKSVYSNFGYNILGRVIEKASGKNYIDYIKQNVASPLGINGIDLGYSGVTQQNEIWYPRDAEVPLVQNMDSHGGLIGSASDIARLFANYWGDGRPRGNENAEFTLEGSLPSTTAIMYQKKNVTVVILLNTRRDQFADQDFNDLLALIKKTVSIK